MPFGFSGYAQEEGGQSSFLWISSIRPLVPFLQFYIQFGQLWILFGTDCVKSCRIRFLQFCSKELISRSHILFFVCNSAQDPGMRYIFSKGGSRNNLTLQISESIMPLSVKNIETRKITCQILYLCDIIIHY